MDRHRWIIIFSIANFLAKNQDVLRRISDEMYGEQDPKLTSDEFFDFIKHDVGAIGLTSYTMAHALSPGV